MDELCACAGLLSEFGRNYRGKTAQTEHLCKGIFLFLPYLISLYRVGNLDFQIHECNENIVDAVRTIDDWYLISDNCISV